MTETRQPLAAGVTSASGAHGPRSARRRNLIDALGATLAGATILWLVDAVRLVARRPPMTAAAQLQGLAASLLVTVLVAAGVGALLGLAWAVSLGESDGRQASAAGWRRIRATLSDGDAVEQRRRVGHAIGILGLLAVGGALSFLATRHLVLALQRPHFVALATLVAHVAILVGLRLALPLALAAGRATSWLVGRVPLLGPPLTRPLVAAALLAAASVAAIATASVLGREALRTLPWSRIQAAALALAGTPVVLLAARRWPRSPTARRRAGRALAALASALLLASTIAALTLKPTRQDARDVLEQEVLASRLAMQVVLLAGDLDRDGHLSFLGGGDCAPLDPRVHPGAIDVPGNKLDEDCSGADLVDEELDAWARWDFPRAGYVPPNPTIVLITVDALAARRMRSLGYRREVTPNLDRLAARSVFFPSCFAQGPSTRLSVPSLFTSRWDTMIRSELIGRLPFPVDGTNVTMAEILRGAGYETAAVLPARFFRPATWKGLTQGFDIVDETAADQHRERSHDHTADQVTAAATRILRQPRSQPLFLWAHYFDAHPPQVQPQGQPVLGPTAEDRYDAELRHVDGFVGQLLSAIDLATGGQALVIVTADHGNGFDTPRHARHTYGQDLNTVTLHVPLLFSARFLKPRRDEGIVSTLDVLPTLVNLLGLDQRLDLQGVSLVPALLEGRNERPQLLFHEFYLHEDLWRGLDPLRQASVRTERYNMIVDRRRGGVYLYDWRDDYLERRNLAEQRRDVVEALGDKLARFLWHSRRAGVHPR